MKSPVDLSVVVAMATLAGCVEQSFSFDFLQSFSKVGASLNLLLQYVDLVHEGQDRDGAKVP